MYTYLLRGNNRLLSKTIEWVIWKFTKIYCYIYYVQILQHEHERTLNGDDGGTWFISKNKENVSLSELYWIQYNW
jgi:hypothetical protein